MARSKPLYLPAQPEVVACDVETSGLFVDDGARVASVGVAWAEEGKVYSRGFSFDHGMQDKFWVTQLDLFGEEEANLDKQAWYALLEWLSHQQLVFHNAKFDLDKLRVGTREWPGLDLLNTLAWDTMVAAHELDPTHSLGLDAIAQRAGLEGKSGKEAIREWLKKRRLPAHRYDLAPWSLVEPYVCMDAEQTLRTYLHQHARFEAGEASWGRFDREMQLLKTLYRMEERGVKYDAEQSLEVAERLEADIKTTIQDLPFECTPNGAKRYFFDKLGLDADRLTKNGAPSLDAALVRRWVKEGVDHAEDYMKVAQTQRAVSMYYRGYPEKLGNDGRLRTSFKQCKVKSGRMSVERVNLQAMPTKRKTLDAVPGVRTLLQAEEGHGLWSLDLSQAELRVASKYSGCRKMLDALRRKVDQHGATCERVLGGKPTDSDWKAKRDVAKRMNFSCIFMVGAETFQETLIKEMDLYLSEARCAELVMGWRAEYPEFQRAARLAQKEAERYSFVRLLPGTRYETQSWFREHDDWDKAWSRIVQGSLAEFMKLWMIEIEREWPGYMLLPVHDSVLLEMPLEKGDKIAAEIAAVGQEMATELFGIEIPVDKERW